MGMLGPLDFHRGAPLASRLSSIFSTSAKDSSSERHSPFSNCLREMAIALDSSAFSRHDSISSHVLSKSATLIITLVLCPFCVMTIGRCVRAVRAKQSLRVRRYSVNGTTSSSRRGRMIGLAFVRIASSPFSNLRYGTLFCTESQGVLPPAIDLGWWPMGAVGAENMV